PVAGRGRAAPRAVRPQRHRRGAAADLVDAGARDPARPDAVVPAGHRGAVRLAGRPRGGDHPAGRFDSAGRHGRLPAPPDPGLHPGSGQPPGRHRPGAARWHLDHAPGRRAGARRPGRGGPRRGGARRRPGARGRGPAGGRVAARRGVAAALPAAAAATRLLTGTARMRVAYTGAETLYGDLVRLAVQGSHARTPLQQAIARLVGVLLVAALAICVLLAAIRLLQGHGLVDALLSAV